MAPKKKERVTVVHEEDLIPLNKLNRHKINTKAFKILKESHKWNEVLISKNTKDVLAGINGLTDSMSDQICEAVNKIMDSLKSQAGVFIQNTVTLLEKAWQNTENDNLKLFFRKAQECAIDFYSRKEILDRLAEEFGEEATKKTHELFFSSKTGQLAYGQMSSIRAAQQKEVGEEEKNEELTLKKEEKNEELTMKNEEIALGNENFAEQKLVGEEEKNEEVAEQNEEVAVFMFANHLHFT